MIKELIESTQNDVQRFKVQKFFDWSVNTDGEVDILVQWRGHDGINNIWDPIQQLVYDVSTMVIKYIKDNVVWTDLDREYTKAVHKT